jgi:hypothetical protein
MFAIERWMSAQPPWYILPCVFVISPFVVAFQVTKQSRSPTNSLAKVLKVFFAGEGLTAAKAYLDQCAANYDRAISNIVGVRLLTKVWMVVKGFLSESGKRLIIRDGVPRSHRR